MTRRAVQTRTLAGAIRTAGLTGLMVLLTLGAAWSLLGPWSLLLAAILAFMAFRSLDAGSLPARLGNARPIAAYEAPGLHEMAEWLASRAGLDTPPRLYLAPSPAPNAAAVGSRDNAVIFLTPSLVRGLSPRELAAVLAHEITHIRNNDLGLYRFTETVRLLAVTSSRMGWILLALSLPLWLVGAWSLPLTTVALLVASPLGAQLLQLAIMRSREFAADLGASEITGDPLSLATALSRIEHTNRWLLRALLPFRVDQEDGLLRSHPATAERVRRLRDLGYAVT